MSNTDRYSFKCEWYDRRAEIVRPYELMWYLHDGTIQMQDLKLKRGFLKRQKVEGLNLDQLYVGSIVTIFARQLKIIDYSDVFTRQNLECNKRKTFGMIKPDAYKHLGAILQQIEEAGFVIGNLKMTKMTVDDAHYFYGEHKGKSFFEKLVKFMTSDFIVGMELVADDSIQKWRTFIGPTNSLKAKQEAPNSLRGQFGTDGTFNACHGSDSPTSSRRELDFFFGENSPLKNTALFNNCTCCVIKPHVLKQKNGGKIVNEILQQGYEISAMKMFHMNRPSAEEFLEVYQGVIPNFNQLCQELTTGPCIAMEIRQENCVNSFRKLCGPMDPDIAKAILPHTLRSKFGVNKNQNGIHCTDLEEDGVLESEYFFNILSQ